MSSLSSLCVLPSVPRMQSVFSPCLFPFLLCQFPCIQSICVYVTFPFSYFPSCFLCFFLMFHLFVTVFLCQVCASVFMLPVLFWRSLVWCGFCPVVFSSSYYFDSPLLCVVLHLSPLLLISFLCINSLSLSLSEHQVTMPLCFLLPVYSLRFLVFSELSFQFPFLTYVPCGVFAIRHINGSFCVNHSRVFVFALWASPSPTNNQIVKILKFLKLQYKCLGFSPLQKPK